jgi:4-hydroxy-tetrahydrodipicolinate reductase
MSEQIAVIISGAAGRMGREVVRAVDDDPELRMVAAVDCRHVGEDAGEVAGIETTGIPIEENLAEAIERARPQVMVDFTVPAAVVSNVVTALQGGVACVVGTTGIDEEGLATIRREAEQAGVGCLIAPNFALGAVLMMKFARQAAPHFPGAEIVEMHHEKKLDKPSGTSQRTAELVSEARGGGDVPIHSIRLPGLVAHQAVLFGGPGETLTIRHDTTDRSCFMPGVVTAIKQVRSITGVVVGLESIL